MAPYDVESDPFPSKTVASTRVIDGWQNAYTGFGTSRDKLTHGYHAGSLGDEELSDLFYSDDVAAKLVEKRPEEAFRRGYKLHSVNIAAADEAFERGRALGVDAKFQEAFTWGRLFGGALLIVGAESGQLWTPLEEKSVREVHFLNVIDRRFARVEKYYSNPLAPNYGQPELYGISGEGGMVSFIHESRVIRFDGAPVDARKRQDLGGWTFSVLQRPYEVMRAFATAFQAAGVLTADASQAVFKMKGLFEMIASGEKERLATRMALVDMSRSSARAVLLDADGEDFTRTPTQFAGLPEMLDRMMMRLASSVDMPVTLLMGRSPAGQNATGDSDFKHWYDSIKSQQSKELTPKLLRLYRILSKGKLEDATIEWAPLSEPSDKEQAEIEFTRAQSDAVYITNGVVIPERVALARFGSGKGKIAVDEDALKKSIELETTFSEELDKARETLGPSAMAALSVSKTVSPAVVSSLITAGPTEEDEAKPPPPPPVFGAPPGAPVPPKDLNAPPSSEEAEPSDEDEETASGKDA